MAAAPALPAGTERGAGSGVTARPARGGAVGLRARLGAVRARLGAVREPPPLGRAVWRSRNRAMWRSRGRPSAHCPKGYLNTEEPGQPGWVPAKPLHHRPGDAPLLLSRAGVRKQNERLVGREQGRRDLSPSTGTADMTRLGGSV